MILSLKAYLYLNSFSGKRSFSIMQREGFLFDLIWSNAAQKRAAGFEVDIY